MNTQIIAFADEFGNNSFDFTNQSTHFIVSGIIVNEDKLDNLEIELEKIRKRHFQTGEIKSNKVATNHTRRLQILNELCELDFSIYALIIDKQKLYGEGFKYKQSFYKYLNGLLYKELYRTFPKLVLFVDEHGSNDYMKSFKNYVKKNHISNLFEGSDFQLQDSTQKIGIQLADFIAGMDKPQAVDPISPELKFVLNHCLSCYYEFGDTGSNRLDFPLGRRIMNSRVRPSMSLTLSSAFQINRPNRYII